MGDINDIKQDFQEKIVENRQGSEEIIDKKVAPEIKSTKQAFRQTVWEYLEKNHLVVFPKPAYGRIPNFINASNAAAQLLELAEFKSAKAIEVNPDKPLENARLIALENHKDLYVPIPRLKNGLLKKISQNEDIPSKKIVSRWGIEHTGKEIGIEDNIKIDLLVLGSVAVSKDGFRIGKGRGYADLEYAVLKEMKAVDNDTVIATVVHDCQVFDELPSTLFKNYDVPVDFILTPTQIIKIEKRLLRPEGIYWNILSQRRVKEMSILQKLKEKHESDGIDTTLKPEDSDIENVRPNWGKNVKRFTKRRPRTAIKKTDDQSQEESLSPTSEQVRRTRYFRRKRSVSAKIDNPLSEDKPKTLQRKRKSYRRYPVDFSLVVTNIEKTVRVRDLKNALIENGIKPNNITWRGYKGFCYLHYGKEDGKKPEEKKEYAVDNVIEVLQKIKLNQDSSCNLSVKVMEPITRIETTDVTSV